MKTLMIVGHPNPQTSQTQQFLYEGAKLSNVEYYNLSMKQQSVESDREMLKRYDRIVFQFPVYWYMAPALLKEWIDRVFVTDLCHLSGKELGVIAVYGTSKSRYQAGGVEKFTPSEMLRPFEMLANFFNMTYLTPFTIFQFAYMSEQDKQQLLVDYQFYLSGDKSQSFHQKGEWLKQQLETIDGSQLLMRYLDELKETSEQLKMVLKDINKDDALG